MINNRADEMTYKEYLDTIVERIRLCKKQKRSYKRYLNDFWRILPKAQAEAGHALKYAGINCK